MSTLVTPYPPITLEQYLEREEYSDTKSEFVDGQLYAMAGANEPHNIIAGNIVFALQLATRATEKRCRIMQSDMKVVIATTPPVSYYPDIVVVCDPTDDTKNFKTRPCLLVEVLSGRTDKTEKKTNYQRIDSLKAYMIVHQDQQLVELYRQQPNGTWQLERYGAGDSLELPCPSTTLRLEQIYEGL